MSGRLDAWFGWYPMGSGGGEARVALAGTDCGWVAAPGADLAGAAALVTLTKCGAAVLLQWYRLCIEGPAGLEGRRGAVCCAARPAQLVPPTCQSHAMAPPHHSPACRLPNTLLPAPCSYIKLMKAAATAGATALVMLAPPGMHSLCWMPSPLPLCCSPLLLLPTTAPRARPPVAHLARN